MELVGQRVDHRHPRGPGHLLDPGLPGRPPDDRADLPIEHPGGVRDRLAAAQLRGLRVDDQRYAAEIGDADGERDPGPGGGLVEDHRDGLRPGQRLVPEPVGDHLLGQRQDLVLLDRAEVVVPQEVPGHRILQRNASSSAGQGRDEAVSVSLAQDVRRRQPNRVRNRVVHHESGVQRERGDLVRHRLGQLDREQQARGRGPRRSTGGPAPRSPTPGGCRRPFTFASRPSRSITVSTARPAIAATGLPPKVVPWFPGCSNSAAAPNPRQAPIGIPAPRPLATVTMSGVIPAGKCANQSPVRPTPVWISSIHSSAPCSEVIRRAACQVAVRRDDHAVLPLDRLEHHRRRLVVHRGGERGRVAVRDEGDVAGQRCELLRGRPASR